MWISLSCHKKFEILTSRSPLESWEMFVKFLFLFSKLENIFRFLFLISKLEKWLQISRFFYKNSRSLLEPENRSWHFSFLFSKPEIWISCFFFSSRFHFLASRQCLGPKSDNSALLHPPFLNLLLIILSLLKKPKHMQDIQHLSNVEKEKTGLSHLFYKSEIISVLSAIGGSWFLGFFHDFLDVHDFWDFHDFREVFRDPSKLQSMPLEGGTRAHSLSSIRVNNWTPTVITLQWRGRGGHGGHGGRGHGHGGCGHGHGHGQSG